MKWVHKNFLRIPIKSWCEVIEEKALNQAENLAMHPVVKHHVALMSDCHMGYGMPIGGVIACENAVIPNAVGKDINCGVRAVRSSLTTGELSLSDLMKIWNLIKVHIPVGFKWNTEPKDIGFITETNEDLPFVTKLELPNLGYQLGTLGGGNHFIEIQEGSDNHIWFMIHCGSRNFGSKVCDYYNDKAKVLNKAWRSNIDERWDLAFLPIISKEFSQYVSEMRIASKFAEENRRIISHIIKECFRTFVHCDFYEDIDIHHNYARLEFHYGKNYWIHRKGATHVPKGGIGLVPGSMGTASYVVEGLGNPESFDSCSHGAGRFMGRMQASKNLNFEDCNKSMDGILFDGWGVNRKGDIDLGEAPGAYKNIDQVIEDQSDIIKPLVKLKPLAVIKAREIGGKNEV